ncbi:MAG: GreA/GreB family elongation factor [Pseudomonadota bacterium]
MKNERYLTQNDAAALSHLAEHLMRLGEVEINAGEQLVDIIATSTILSSNVQRKGHISLHASVTYAPVNNEEDKRTVSIVCPREADPQLARISVLTPIGLALIGRKVLNTIEVALPSNRVEKIKVLDVTLSDSTSDEPVLS